LILPLLLESKSVQFFRRCFPHASRSKSREKAAPIKTILVVEDDTGIAEFLSLAIAQETPYYSLVVADGSEALRIMQQITPNLLIIDYRLPQMNGIELYDLLEQTEGPKVPPTIIESASIEKLEKELKERHLVGLSKPLELGDLLQMIEQMLAARAEVPFE
jgi:CheY-like chemotaxis protein